MVIGRNLLSIRELERLAHEEGEEFDPAGATSPDLAAAPYSHADEAFAALAETISQHDKDRRRAEAEDGPSDGSPVASKQPRTGKSWPIGASDVVEPVYRTQV
jgi:hypothetical protein